MVIVLLAWLIMYFLSYIVKRVGRNFGIAKFLRKSSLLYGDCVGISHLVEFNLLTGIFAFLLLLCVCAHARTCVCVFFFFFCQ